MILKVLLADSDVNLGHSTYLGYCSRHSRIALSSMSVTGDEYFSRSQDRCERIRSIDIDYSFSLDFES